jgi:hypothetical protein
VVVTAEPVEISYVLPFEGAPQVADHPGSTPEGTPSHVYRLRLADLDPPALVVELGEVGDTVDRRIEQRSNYKLFGSVDILGHRAHVMPRRCARWQKWD